MACNWVPSIIAVNIANNRASKTRNKIKTTVAGGENDEHCFHSTLTHIINWFTDKNRECREIIAI